MRTVDEVIEVDAPATEVWARWTDLDGLPDVMEGIESVRREEGDRVCQEAGEGFDPGLSKADASRRIDELQQRTGRGV